MGFTVRCYYGPFIFLLLSVTQFEFLLSTVIYYITVKPRLQHILDAK